MRSDCIDAVTRAAGRSLTAPEIRDIEGRLLQAVRANARENRAAAMQQTPAERLAAAAERVARELEADKARAVQNVARQVIAHDRNQSYIDEQAKRGISRTDAVQQLIINTLDNRSGAQSLESRFNGVAREALGRFGPLAQATQKYLGFWTNRKNVRDIMRELWGVDTGNAAAKEAAGVWQDGIAEPLRKQVNENGGDIRKLPGWAAPQSHSQMKVARESTENWMQYVLPRLNRDAYVNADGSLMDDTQMRQLLGDAYLSISTDGAWNFERSEGVGQIKNRGTQSRVLHFKDGDAYMDYQARYGERSLVEGMTAHVHAMARQIAAMQTFGPNDVSGFQALLDAATRGDTGAGKDTNAIRDQAQRIETQFKMATGRMGTMGSPAVAHAFQIIRSTISSMRLGSAALSAVTDSSNMIMVARAWNMPAYRSWARWESKAWTSPEFRQFMRGQGVGVEAITHAISRFGEEVFGHGISGAWANTTFRISGLNFIDNVRRTATGAMLMERIGHLTREHETIESMHPDDSARLRAMGVDGSTWNVWRKAELEGGLLTPNGIKNIEGVHDRVLRDAAQKLIGTISADIDTVVPMPTLKAQASIEHATHSMRGNVLGELGRSALQFKSFPLAMISNHWQRLQSMPTPGGKALYAAELIATSTILGALSVQMKSMVSGQNPQDMTTAKFAGRAFVQGGSGGLYGDMIINPLISPYRQHIADQLGPMFSAASDLYELGQTIVNSRNPDKKVDVGGDVTKFVRSNTPGLSTFASLFYTKAMFDHFVFQRLQDYFSPGYAQRSEQRAQTNFGSTMWWKPSRAQGVTPPTTPDLSTALGPYGKH